jgi:hypothetical protein
MAASPTLEKNVDYSSSEGASDLEHAAPEILERPTGLKGLYYNPYTQIVMLGFVCFMYVYRAAWTVERERALKCSLSQVPRSI